MDYEDLRRDILEEFASFDSAFELPHGWHVTGEFRREDRRDYFRVYNKNVRPHQPPKQRKENLSTNAKLDATTATIIRSMKDMGASNRWLAKKFMVSKRTIERLIRRDTYNDD